MIDKFVLDNLKRTELFNNIFLFIDKYFNYYFLAALISLIPLLKKQNRKIIFIKLWISFLISGFFVYILKNFIKRERPMINITDAVGYSLPSGHTTVIFAILPIIWIYFKELRYTWLAISLILAFSRIYLGVHYFTDVIFGIILGLTIGILVLKINIKKYFK